MKRIWHGEGRTLKNPARFVALEDFTFGGQVFPKGWKISQHESANFGWTIGKLELPDGHIQTRIAKE